MNRSNLKRIGAAIVIATASYTSIGVFVASGAEAPIAIPATAAEIWKQIDMHVAELQAVVKSGVLKTVHVHAFAIRDLVRGLPTHSPALKPEALKTVTDQSKFVDTLAERLDQTGDANDKPGTESNLKKLEAILKSIRANYPAGT